MPGFLAATFTHAERSYLSSRTTARIATASPAGLPDVARVEFVLDGESLLVRGMGSSEQVVNTARFRNVLVNPHATVIVDDDNPQKGRVSRGVKAYGLAAIEQRPQGVLIRLTPQSVISWAINSD